MLRGCGGGLVGVQLGCSGRDGEVSKGIWGCKEEGIAVLLIGFVFGEGSCKSDLTAMHRMFQDVKQRYFYSH